MNSWFCVQDLSGDALFHKGLGFYSDWDGGVLAGEAAHVWGHACQEGQGLVCGDESTFEGTHVGDQDPDEASGSHQDLFQVPGSSLSSQAGSATPEVTLTVAAKTGSAAKSSPAKGSSVGSKTSGQREEDQASFEDLLRQLESIIATFEADPPPPLDQAIAAYERGVVLQKACLAKLDEARAKIETVLAGAGQSDKSPKASLDPDAFD